MSARRKITMRMCVWRVLSYSFFRLAHQRLPAPTSLSPTPSLSLKDNSVHWKNKIPCFPSCCVRMKQCTIKFFKVDGGVVAEWNDKIGWASLLWLCCVSPSMNNGDRISCSVVWMSTYKYRFVPVCWLWVQQSNISTHFYSSGLLKLDCADL